MVLISLCKREACPRESLANLQYPVPKIKAEKSQMSDKDRTRYLCFPTEKVHSFHRITESLRLKKISEIIKSYHYPSTAEITTKPCHPSAISSHFLKTSRGW